MVRPSLFLLSSFHAQWSNTRVAWTFPQRGWDHSRSSSALRLALISWKRTRSCKALLVNLDAGTTQYLVPNRCRVEYRWRMARPSTDQSFKATALCSASEVSAPRGLRSNHAPANAQRIRKCLSKRILSTARIHRPLFLAIVGREVCVGALGLPRS